MSIANANREGIKRGLISISLCMVAIGIATVRELPAAGVRDVASAWRSREASTSSVHIIWNVRIWHFLDPETVHESSGEFAFETSGRFRLEVDNFNPAGGIGIGSNNPGSRSTGSLDIDHAVKVFDGKESTILFAPGNNREFPRAYIGTDRLDRHAYTLPLRLIYLPFDARAGEFRVADLKDTGDFDEVDGKECIVLQVGRDRLWVTNDERYLLVRFDRLRAEERKLLCQVNIEYEQSEGGEWRPSAWKMVGFGVDGQTIIESQDAIVSTYSINEPLRDEMFAIEIPDGTWVRNYNTDERYMIRHAKGNRVVLPGEFTGQNYEQLATSEPPDVRGQMGGLSWLWLGNALLIVFMVGAWYWKTRTSQTPHHDAKGPA